MTGAAGIRSSGHTAHVVDPINPGAVDSIIHLGDYWNEEGIRKNRDSLISCNDRIRTIFNRAYNYLAAAGKMYDNLSSIYQASINHEELYKITAHIIGDELAHKEISSSQGGIRKYFASAITPDGFRNYIDSLFSACKKIYLIKAPIGVSGERILELFMESAVYRGFNTEGYYCPMKPSEKLEHLLIPQLGLGFVTSNQYHPIDPSAWDAVTVTLDLENILCRDKIQYQAEILEDSKTKMDALLAMAIVCIDQAKKEHDGLEKFYIPNMDFLGIDELRQNLTHKFSQR